MSGTFHLVNTIRPALKQSRMLMSRNKEEAKRRSLAFYKMFYRQIPYIVHDYDIELTVEEGRRILREKMEVNKHIEDIRMIDALIIKGQMELVEMAEIWQTKSHIMNFFAAEQMKKRNDKLLNKSFMEKFLEEKN
ncbi:hypothetical protein SNEBB_001348 [Seison nebaliae]|nr:hypothetical protein SNEBB_001348 [Seison nebaliae]